MNHCLLFSTFQYYQARTSGMHRIATHLRKQNWDAECIDFVSAWSLHELQQLAQLRITKDTKFVGFSFLFDGDFTPHLAEFCSWLKSTYPDLVLIAGGQGYSVLDENSFDYHIIGYGEYGLDALLSYKFSNGPMPKFRLSASKTKIIDTLHYYPAHPFRDPIIEYEDRDFIHPAEWLGIEFSRGCKFQCDYCNFPVLGVKGDYTRDAESFRKQMVDTYDKFGVTNYYTSDETFNDRTEKIIKFADVVETLSFTPYFSGFMRPDLLVRRLRDREELLRMNFLGHYYGVESFNHESAKSVGKGMDPIELKQGLLECKQYFQKKSNNLYVGTIGLLIGLPHETIESLDDTLAWLNANWADQSVATFPLHIMDNELDRSSKISLDYKKYGYESVGDIVSGPTLNNKGINWKSKWMDVHTAIKYSKSINSQWYHKYDNFALSRIQEKNNGQLLTLQEKLNSPKSYSTNDQFLKNYITKKLNWTG